MFFIDIVNEIYQHDTYTTVEENGVKVLVETIRSRCILIFL